MGHSRERPPATMSKNVQLMKATVKFPVEESAVKMWNGKRACDVIVTGEDNLTYVMWAVEGSPLWTVKEGDSIDIDVTEAASPTSRGKAKLTGQQRSGGGGWGKPREAQKPNAEYAKERAAIAAATYRYIAEHTAKVQPAPTSEDIRSIVNTILMDI